MPIEPGEFGAVLIDDQPLVVPPDPVAVGMG
jgi:hypothetical protein